MSNTEALRLADALDSDPTDITGHKASAHIRRLVAESEALQTTQAELAGALQWIADCRTGGLIEGKARAALAKVEESK